MVTDILKTTNNLIIKCAISRVMEYCWWAHINSEERFRKVNLSFKGHDIIQQKTSANL
jgi:hypothetical protein